MLTALAASRDGATTTAGLADKIDGAHDTYVEGYSSVQSAMRRALAGLKARGLVTGERWYASSQGRPVLWQITEAGRDYLTRS